MLKIGITIGDPAGVGPELIVRLGDHLSKDRAYVIYGEEKIIRLARSLFNPNFEYEVIQLPEDIKDPGVYLIDLNISQTDRPLPSHVSGIVAIGYLGRAVVDLVYGKIDGLVTMPISKFWAKMAGFAFEGQTEFITSSFRVKDYAMMMYSSKVKVVLLSTHVPLSEAIKQVTKENINKKVKLVSSEYKRLFGKEPSIGVLGLNPHAGEGGQIGNEELEHIYPAIEELKMEGYMVEGPLSPDTAFMKASEYDLFLCMYHDQGLIPFKLLAFDEGVNLTLGIPKVRTSPDHGTAYDIAWKGIANLGPSVSALHLCEKLSEGAAS